MADINMRKKSKHKFGVYFVVLVYTLITAVPLYFILINTFKKKPAISLSPMSIPVKSFTLDNITRSWSSLKYVQSLMNTVIIVVISCILLIIIGSLAGYSISIVNSRFLNRFYVFAILIITIPFQVIMVPLVIELDHVGLLDNYFGTSLVFTGILTPISIFLYTGFMRTLPRELCESAVVDGCGMFKTYLYIYMPLMKTITGTVLIIKGSTIWNDFLTPLVTLSSAEKLPLVVRLYSFASVRMNSWDLMFGSTFLCSIPIVIVFIALQKSFIRGIVAGAVKG